jgi:hypothetical protein
MQTVSSHRHRWTIADWKRASFYCPSLRFHRHLRNYEADDKGVRKSQDSFGCERKGERDLTSGILTAHCPHGIVQGFTFLRNPESERDVFKLFASRCADGVLC